MAELNCGEALLGLQVRSWLAAVVLVLAGVGVAMNAHATRTRPVLSDFIGMAIIAAAGVALFPYVTTPSGQR